jgi:hypothetical protein
MWRRRGIWIGFRSAPIQRCNTHFEEFRPSSTLELPQRARVEGKSLNEVAIEALARGASLTATPRVRRNVDDIAGSWKEDKAFDEAIADQHQIDEDLWK